MGLMAMSGTQKGEMNGKYPPVLSTMAGNYRCKWEADRCIDVIKRLLGEYDYQRVLRLTVKGI